MNDVFIYYTEESDYEIDVIFKLSGYIPIGAVHSGTPNMRGYYCSSIKTNYIDLFGSFGKMSRIDLRQNSQRESEKYNYIIVNKEEFMEKFSDSLKIWLEHIND